MTDQRKRMTKEERMKLYAKILPEAENQKIWAVLHNQFGIQPEQYQGKYGFVENRKGRLWLGSKKALEFVADEGFDPAKVLTLAIGRRITPTESNVEGVRLTLDGVLFFGPDALQKNLLQLTPAEEALWFSGQTITREGLADGAYILASASHGRPIGCTTCKNGLMYNFVPKWRRYPRPS